MTIISVPLSVIQNLLLLSLGVYRDIHQRGRWVSWPKYPGYLGKPQKSYYLLTWPLRRGVSKGPLKKKELFIALFNLFKKSSIATKLEGVGGKALVAIPLKKYFFAASLTPQGDARKKALAPL